jgi:hypothetical protein
MVFPPASDLAGELIGIVVALNTTYRTGAHTVTAVAQDTGLLNTEDRLLLKEYPIPPIPGDEAVLNGGLR